jgi:hypothetical protein
VGHSNGIAEFVVRRARSIFTGRRVMLQLHVLVIVAFVVLSACSDEMLAEETARAVESAREDVTSAAEVGGSVEDAQATADAAEFEATAGPKSTIVSATTTAEAIATRETQNDLVEIADTALANNDIDLDQFIVIAETIKAGGDPGDEFDELMADILANRPPEPEAEELPTLVPTQPVLPTVEPTPVKATEYRSVEVFVSDDWEVGDATANAVPREGSKGGIGLGFIDLFYTRSKAEGSNYDWTIEFSFGSPYADQVPGRTITLIGRAKVTGGGSDSATFDPLDMYFISTLPPESIEIVRTTGPLKIKAGEKAQLEVSVSIPKGDVGDWFTLGWGVRGCAEDCEYFWTYAGQ